MPKHTFNVYENECPWYKERTRMYDEVVEECGEAKDQLTTANQTIEGLREEILRMDHAWNIQFQKNIELREKLKLQEAIVEDTFKDTARLNRGETWALKFVEFTLLPLLAKNSHWTLRQAIDSARAPTPKGAA